MLPTPATEAARSAASPVSPGLPAPSTARALRHVLLAGALGILTALVGAPVVVASMFGGLGAVLVAVAVLAGVASVLAVALDRAAGPGGCGRPGSVPRGVTLGVISSAAVVVLAFVALHQDVGDGLPVLLRYAAAGLPFATIAALQWPGLVRLVTAVALVVAIAAVAAPRVLQAAQQVRAADVATEVGTTARPWVTDVSGTEVEPPHVTGSPLIWTGYRPASASTGTDTFWLFRDDPVDPVEMDPCTAHALRTPGGQHRITSCTRIADDRWLRTSESWQELVRSGPDVQVGVVAGREASLALLEQALDAARPMTDAEYEVWLDEGLPPGS